MSNDLPPLRKLTGEDAVIVPTVRDLRWVTFSGGFVDSAQRLGEGEGSLDYDPIAGWMPTVRDEVRGAL